jgi:hypothetical protein
MTVIVVLWLISVGLYYYDYRLGFDVLFLISFLHVFLEFPLNHVSFIGIYTEAKAIFSGSSVQAQPIKGKKR